jgi:hypothetical protein
MQPFNVHVAAAARQIAYRIIRNDFSMLRRHAAAEPRHRSQTKPGYEPSRESGVSLTLTSFFAHCCFQNSLDLLQ